MKRTLIVIIVAVAALALLVGAVLKSRSIPLEGHIAYYQLTPDLERLTDDYETLVDSLQTSWRKNLPPAEVAGTLSARIVEASASIEQSSRLMPAGTTERQRIDSSYSRLSGAVAKMEQLAAQLLAEQTDFAQDLTSLRENGADLARELRARGRARLASDISALLSRTFDSTQPGNANNDGEIPFLLTTLHRDIRIDSNLPRDLPQSTESLLAKVESLLDAKGDIDSHLYQLGVIPVVESARSLERAADAGYQGAVASADRARAVLAVYAVVLLLVIGVIAYRLRHSYRQLNLANEELGELNESLELRVEERTEKLSNALTELKDSQVQLVQAEKMSSLGQLVAGISHEINTPLLYLANNAELTQERVEVISDFVRQISSVLCVSREEFTDSTGYQTHLIKGLRSVTRLLREHELEATVEELADLNRDSLEGLADLSEIAQSLKDFSRLDRAPIDSFDVNAGIEKTLTIARNIVKHKAEVIKDYGELPPIECSPSKINQVFLNVITNAVQAIEEHGEITITTRRRGDDQIVISIRDTGCGIPAENLSRVCDPFFTTKAVGSGTGLGLSIVDDIVRAHGGRLLIQSDVGVGSTFSIVLPIRQGGTASEPEVDTLLAEAV